MGQQYDWHCERALLDLTTARRVEIQEAGDVLAEVFRCTRGEVTKRLCDGIGGSAWAYDISAGVTVLLEGQPNPWGDEPMDPAYRGNPSYVDLLEALKLFVEWAPSSNKAMKSEAYANARAIIPKRTAAPAPALGRDLDDDIPF